MKKYILLLSIIFLFLPVVAWAMIGPPTTWVKCTIIDEFLNNNACLNEDCSIKAIDNSVLLEGDCWNTNCTRKITKDEAEQSRLNGNYRFGNKTVSSAQGNVQ